MNVTAERVALATLLDRVDGLETYPRVPAKPNLPAAIVAVSPFEPHAALGDSVDAKFTVQVLVQWADWESAQDALDDLISSGTLTSVVDALEAGGGHISVDRIEAPGTIDLDDGQTKAGSILLHVTVMVDS